MRLLPALLVPLALAALASCDQKFDHPWLKPQAAAEGGPGLVTQDRTVGPWTELAFQAVGRLVLDPAVPAGTVRVKASAADQENLEVRVEGHRLVLNSGEGLHLGPQDIEFRTAAPADLTALTLEGLGSVEAAEALTLDHGLKLTLAGLGSIHLEVKVKDLTLDQSGAGELKVTGQAEALKVDASGAGSVEARNLETLKADVTSSGVGAVSVRAQDLVKVRSSGVGSVTFYGHPAQTDVQNSGLTQVKAGD